MTVAHVHTEVEKPPLQAADALRTAVRRFQTEDRSMPEEPGARAAAAERLRAARTLAWTLRISSGISKGIYKSVVQSDGEFLRIWVGGGQ